MPAAMLPQFLTPGPPTPLALALGRNSYSSTLPPPKNMGASMPTASRFRLGATLLGKLRRKQASTFSPLLAYLVTQRLEVQSPGAVSRGVRPAMRLCCRVFRASWGIEEGGRGEGGGDVSCSA